MAHHGYMTITGETQGHISAGCSTQESIGNKCQDGHADEIMVLSFNHNMSNIGNIRHATHQPVVITKNIDKSSPLLAQALANREEINCKIDFFRNSVHGKLEKFYTVELIAGFVADLSVDIPHSIQLNDSAPLEHIAISYRDIIWTHHKAGTIGYASWIEKI
ncbi:Hcp family type VI secretion system effector [Pseudomonas cichorii]|uniref:Hcp family type VI secretion system effector n=1 Tax=Pseudomonas cichorii TaxID=36746 RepID=UPI001C8AAFDD|nr:Hcp family type VI secretion system effector [Pseudomonas cichorii]MBX8487183.1 Hcp family type VI secretion system effector [Pseudomonas cichorii]MBX8532205.1 Hcp family type VI secretion system effector [Pseudomonas cichorii]